MQLKMTTDYAIRAVLYLASTKRVTTASEIADNMGIPKNYLINLIAMLRKSGIVCTQVGLYGGYYLGYTPEQISLYDIICATEGTIKINRCLEDDQYCSRNAASTCPVHAAYQPIQTMMEFVFQHTTIADLLNGSAHDKVEDWLNAEVQG